MLSIALKFLSNRRLTISEAIERSLRKGRSEEQCAAVLLAPLVCIQLGTGDASQEVCKELKPILIAITLDQSVLPSTRAKVCYVLFLIKFMTAILF